MPAAVVVTATVVVIRLASAGDCCDVGVGKVVAVLVKRCCRACPLQAVKVQWLVRLMQWMVMGMVGSQWLLWGPMVPVVGVRVELVVVRRWLVEAASRIRVENSSVQA